jgi:DNA-binding transcriptional MerR regulator
MAQPEPRGRLVPIGRFAKLAGLTVPQLRHYDRRGILPPAARDRTSGYRYYSEAQAQAARVIALLRSIDVPLADIQELLAAPEPERVRRVFADHRLRVERRLGEASAALESIDRIIRRGELVDTDDDDRCSFCDRPASKAPARLVADGGAAICGRCVDLALEVLEIDARDPKPSKPRPPEGERPGWVACAFCGRDRTNVSKLVAGPNVAICDGCLHGIAA